MIANCCPLPRGPSALFCVWPHMPQIVHIDEQICGHPVVLSNLGNRRQRRIIVLHSRQIQSELLPLKNGRAIIWIPHDNFFGMPHTSPHLIMGEHPCHQASIPSNQMPSSIPCQLPLWHVVCEVQSRQTCAVFLQHEIQKHFSTSESPIKVPTSNARAKA
jgi:hypothetical protein